MEITDLYAHSLEGANDRIVSLGFFKANLPSGCDSKVEGTNYVLVSGWRTPEENGIELLSKYLEVMNMGGYTASNRFAIVMGPGYYDFGVETFKVTESYIDIVSLTGGCDVHFSGIEVSAANVILRGIDTGNAPFFIGNNLNKLICENCKGGDYSFGPYEGEVSGTFSYCAGGDNSFGGGGTASGTFSYCAGGEYSFGGDGGEASGTFSYCTGDNGSFGGAGGIASGTFTGCTGGEYSFGGGGGTASGTFSYCTGDNGSFGGGGTASGTFSYCAGGEYSFGGGGGEASGTFTNCEGGDNSFGSAGGIASGTFTNCTGGNGSFGGGYGGTASGTFTGCTGGEYSFGGGGEGTTSTSAKFYYCTGGAGSNISPATVKLFCAVNDIAL